MRHDFRHPCFGDLPRIDDVGSDPVVCKNCGPITHLTSGWLLEDEEPTALLCAGCGAPAVLL